MADIEQSDLTTLTVDLLSAYFASNSIASDQLSGLIRTTHEALKGLHVEPASDNEADEHVAAVSIRKSLASPDHILSMIDGRPYKTLKRHIGRHGLTPAEYRTRYKLPSDYPLVSKNYSEHRRNVANQLGLGRKVRSPAPTDMDARKPADTLTDNPDATKPRATKAKPVATTASPVSGSAPQSRGKRRPASAKAAVPADVPATAPAEAPSKTGSARRSKLSIAKPKA